MICLWRPSTFASRYLSVMTLSEVITTCGLIISHIFMTIFSVLLPFGTKSLTNLALEKFMRPCVEQPVLMMKILRLISPDGSETSKKCRSFGTGSFSPATLGYLCLSRVGGPIAILAALMLLIFGTINFA